MRSAPKRRGKGHRINSSAHEDKRQNKGRKGTHRERRRIETKEGWVENVSRSEGYRCQLNRGNCTVFIVTAPGVWEDIRFLFETVSPLFPSGRSARSCTAGFGFDHSLTTRNAVSVCTSPFYLFHKDIIPSCGLPDITRSSLQ